VNLLRRDKTALKAQLIRRSAFNLARLLGTLRLYLQPQSASAIQLPAHFGITQNSLNKVSSA